MTNAFIYELDYMGHHRPKFEISNAFISKDISRMVPMVYDIVYLNTLYFSNNTLFRNYYRGWAFYQSGVYRLGFNISSLKMDHKMDLLIILDSNLNLFVICYITNFIKLLATMVTDFEYSPHIL
ncbi:hypothetical protein RF11_06574 [Thelohanellus kitauei]|uniref:Uncharacterized protein n=1 Tax=Thelohanellus kitauei TaxID=669202 RepID=A0A0C2N570_THEKT|nr:hypothetical protein RF11_06574 [Thelohanellus kitauei]